MPTGTKRSTRPRRINEVRNTSAPKRVFVALDFETADYFRDSACSVALVRVEGNKIVDRQHHLIQPPRRDFKFTHLHGITWSMVAKAPTFARVWPKVESLLEGAAFVAAHNAGFDRSVLKSCSDAAGLSLPPLDFLCSVRLAKQTWGLKTATLPDVCRFLGIALDHHKAMSDAEACARIILAAEAAGGNLPVSAHATQRLNGSLSHPWHR